jgi:hypothetical protein
MPTDNSLSDLTRLYQQHIGQHPLRDTAFLAGTAGLGMYAASKPLLSVLSRTLAAGNPQLQEASHKYLHGPDSRKGRRRLAIVAALLGAGYGAVKHSGIGAQGPVELPESVTVSNQFKLQDKAASVRMTSNIIDKNQAINYIVTDPVLYDSNKRKVAGLVNNSSPGPWTTPAQIGYTAIKAGAGFGAGYMLSQGLGSILAMPAPLVSRLSTTGGIASAVIGSGILRQLA